MKVFLKIDAEEIATYIQAAMLSEADGYYNHPCGWSSVGGFYCEPADKINDLFRSQWVVCPLDCEGVFSTVLKKHSEMNPDTRVFGWQTSAGNFIGVSPKGGFLYFNARRHAVQELLRFLPGSVDVRSLEVLAIESQSSAPWYKAGV